MYVILPMIDILFYNEIKSCRFAVFLIEVIRYSIMGEIRDVLLKSLKDNPDVLKKLEMEESDDKTRALLQLILKEIQDDPEYSGINH